MTNERIQELAAGYSLDALSAEERELFEQLLREGNPQAVSLFREFSAVTGYLPFAAEAQPVDPALKKRIIDSLQAQEAGSANIPAPAATQTKLVSPIWKRLTYGMSIAALFLLFSGLFYINSLKREIAELHSRNSVNSSLIENLRRQLEQQENFVAMLQAPELLVVQLDGQADAPQSSGRVFYSPDKQQGIFVSSTLSSLTEEQVYQLWMIKGTQPVSAGLIKRNSDGLYSAELPALPDLENIDAFAVSLEPAGGVSAPTGPILLVGSVKKS